MGAQRGKGRAWQGPVGRAPWRGEAGGSPETFCFRPPKCSGPSSPYLASVILTFLTLLCACGGRDLPDPEPTPQTLLPSFPPLVRIHQGNNRSNTERNTLRMFSKDSCSNKKYQQVTQKNYDITIKLGGKFVVLYLIQEHVQVILII